VCWPARACKERATARAGSRQHRGEKERGSQRWKKKNLGKKLEERNKMDLNKIWEKKRGDTRAAPTIVAGEAHAADRSMMVMRRDGGAGGKGRGTGNSAEKDDCAMSGRWKIGGWASGTRVAENVLKNFKQVIVIGNAIINKKKMRALQFIYQ
jgi:hypothetical protein